MPTDRNRPRRAPVMLLAATVFAGACVPPPVAPPPPALPPAFPEDVYREARARGEPVWRLDPQRSLVVIRVYRGGPLARFGHDHVIAARELHGYVLVPRARGAARADLYVALDTLSVDEPALRAAAGLDTTPTAEDIAGTRRNMLDRTLAASRHPFVVVQLTAADDAAPPSAAVDAAIALHGTTRTLRVPVALAHDGDTLRASGELALRQSDFGIAPFSVFGGALRVEDQVDVRFDLYARRL
jgi:hypothetical protein